MKIPLPLVLLVLIISLSTNFTARADDFVVMDDDMSHWSKFTAVSSPVQSGAYAGSWNEFGLVNSRAVIATPHVPSNWLPYESLKFWAYSSAALGAQFNVIIETQVGNITYTGIEVDWIGWKEIELPLDDFNDSGLMNQVLNLSFYNFGWGVNMIPGANLLIDDVRLTPLKRAEVVILDESVAHWSDLTLSNSQSVRGNYSAEWVKFGLSNSLVQISNPEVPDDWRGYETISYWMYSPTFSNAKYNLILKCETGYFYKTHLNVDWVGWKYVEFSLDTFAATSGASWDKITDVQLYNHGWGLSLTPGASVYLDDMRLQPSYAMLLDEGVNTWSNVGEVIDDDLVWKGRSSAELLGFDTTNRLYAATYPVIPTDWSRFDRMSLRVHSNAASGSLFNLVILSDAGSYFCKLGIPVDWVGWKRLEFELSDFTKAGAASWSDVEAVQIYNHGWTVTPANNGTVVHIDDIEIFESPVFHGHDWTAVISTAQQTVDPAFDYAGLLSAHVGESILQRPNSLAEIAPEYMDTRVGNFPASHPNKEVFALAMADKALLYKIKAPLISAAVSARDSGTPAAIDFVHDQLAVIVGHGSNPGWSPLQRSGWTKFDVADLDPLPPEGDGVWLATGFGLHAILDTIQIMGDLLDDDLRESCIEFIHGEIDLVEHSWYRKIPHYVRSQSADSNQWIIPSSGLLYACLFVGRHDSSLSLAIDNMVLSLEALGQDGGYSEGYSYNDFSTTYLNYAAWRLLENTPYDFSLSPFLSQNGDWVISHLMPGGLLNNSSDSRLNRYQEVTNSFALSAIITEGPSYMRAASNVFSSRHPDAYVERLLLNYYFYATTSVDDPELFYAFPSRHMASWRSSWDNLTASAIWMKGSASNDGHANQDAGHFSLYVSGSPVLIECGTPDYSDPDKATKFDSILGHNVLQASPRSSVQDCPMTVNSLSASGGDITLELENAYTDVTEWTRNVLFDAYSATITDVVVLSSPKSSSEEWFRFHTSSTVPVTISGAGGNWTVSWGAHTISFSSNVDILVSQVLWDDHTLSSNQKTQHYCVVIETLQRESSMHLQSIIAGL